MRTIWIVTMWCVLLGLVIPGLLWFILLPTPIPYWFNSFRTLPPMPCRTPRYTIRDAGLCDSKDAQHEIFFGSSFIPYGHIDAIGHVHAGLQEESDKELDNTYRIDRLILRHLGLRHTSDTYVKSSKGSYALVRTQGSERLYGDRALISVRRAGVSGYHGSLFRKEGLCMVNKRGEVIGNAVIETVPPSCTHPTFGRVRSMPLIWRGEPTAPEDLNTKIAESSGWYLDRAFDINDRGQILCIARRTDVKGAERFESGPPFHLVVLSPLSSR